MKRITLILPYYNNAGMLAEQQRVWRSYPEDVKSNLDVIVVDDHSPHSPAAHVAERNGHGLSSFRLYRAGVDIRWNWLFCRNLGASEAVTDWLLLTDIDHIVPAETMRAVMEDYHYPGRVYRFARRSMPDLSDYHPHADSFLMTRALFWEIGGYDERFSGWYGSSSDIRHRMKAKHVQIDLLPQHLIRYPREVIPDASTPKETNGRPSRKLPEDDAALKRIRAEIASLPPAKRKPVTLNIPWDRLI